MTISEAHKISLMGYVASLGYKPTQTHNGRYVCNSPFRPDETTPSFYLYDDPKRGKWIYKDFGSAEKKGGDIIDFIMTLHNVNELGALMILDSPELSISKYLSFIGHSSKETTESNLKIKHIQPLQNRALIQYLESRKIPFDIASRYVQEAYYNTYEGQVKPFFSVAWRNDDGGYELRSGFKSIKYPNGPKLSTTPKTITTIPGHPARVNIFEGFSDLLSAMVYYQQPEPRNTTIVLNSTANLPKLWDILPTFNQVNLFLDNDQSGIMAANEIQSMFPVAVNKSKVLFPQYKDFSDFINSKKMAAQ